MVSLGGPNSATPGISKPGALGAPPQLFSNAFLVSGVVGRVHWPAVRGMFQVKVKVASPAHPERHFEEMFWADTGALTRLFQKTGSLQLN
jgi:hypothetical protein